MRDRFAFFLRIRRQSVWLLYAEWAELASALTLAPQIKTIDAQLQIPDDLFHQANEIRLHALGYGHDFFVGYAIVFVGN